jgi:hypothetical protein
MLAQGAVLARDWFINHLSRVAVSANPECGTKSLGEADISTPRRPTHRSPCGPSGHPPALAASARRCPALSQASWIPRPSWISRPLTRTTPACTA